MPSRGKWYISILLAGKPFWGLGEGTLQRAKLYNEPSSRGIPAKSSINRRMAKHKQPFEVNGAR